MNDLAEKALHGLDAARRHLVARPVAPLATLGFLAASVIVVAGGRIGAAPAALPLNTWLGLEPPAGYEITNVIPGLVMLGAIAVLVILWLVTLYEARQRALSERGVWIIGGGWALPLLIGPPLLSTDVYRYVANGLLARRALSPYHHGPSELGETPLVNAIDPTWRSAHSVGGPLSSAIEHLLVSISAGNPLGAVILLRVLAVASTIAIGRLAGELAGRRRVPAIAITALNPATLLFVVSGAHLDGLFVALVLAAVVAAQRRRWVAVILLACLAAGVKPIGLIAVVAVIVAHTVGRRVRLAWQVAVRDVAIAVLALTACVLAEPHGLGWVGQLGSVTREHTPFAPASLTSDLMSLIVSAASFDDLAVGGRAAAALAALTAVCYLLATIRTRPLERTIGYALLAAGLLGPVLFPWYLLWGLLCLAPTALRARRDWVIALSVAACVIAPAGFATRTGEVVASCALAVVATALGIRLRMRRRRTAEAARRVSAR